MAPSECDHPRSSKILDNQEFLNDSIILEDNPASGWRSHNRCWLLLATSIVLCSSTYMRKYPFEFEYDGKLNGPSLWRDNPYYSTALRVKQTLALHEGCVNTICWSEDGEYLLSGSDDRRICLSHIFPEFSQIVVGFKCGCVVKVRTDASPESMVQAVYSHKYAVYDVLTFPDQPTCFMTLSHDQSAVCFDTRQPTRSGIGRSVCNQRCRQSDALNGAAIAQTNHMVGCARLSFEFPVTAGDVHPIDGSRRVALGCADGFVRLFDLRRFTKSGVSPSGEPTQPLPYQLTRPLGLPAQLTERRSLRLDYGPAHITSVKFEPIYSSGSAFRRHTTQSRDPARYTPGGRHLLVSHMYAPVFLFDLARKETAVSLDEKTVVDWLPRETAGAEAPARSNATTRPVRVVPPNSEHHRENGKSFAARRCSLLGEKTTKSVDSDLDLRIVLAFFQWLESQRASRQSVTDTGRSHSNESTETRDSDEVTLNQSIATSTTTNRSTGETESNESANVPITRVSPLEALTDAYVADVLSSAPRASQRTVYKGRRSCRTVIKAATFWGKDFILSGSECGHVIMWDRWSDEPVHAIRADSAVVNRIAPHPVLPMFACSGIDRSVKLIEPNPSIYDTDDEDDNEREKEKEEEEDVNEETTDRRSCYTSTANRQAKEATRLCEENSSYMIESLRAGSLHLDRLARLRTGQVLRNILRRMANTEESGASRDPSSDTAAS